MTNTPSTRPSPRRWPALTLTGALLAYAAGKAWFAAQGRLGLPGGPVVPVAEMQRYAAETMPVTTAQWLATASGLAGAAVVLATVLPVNARLGKVLLSALLAVTLAALGSGAAIVVLDATVGLGAGWQPVHAVLAAALLALMALTAHGWVRRLRRLPGAAAGRPASRPVAAR